MNHSTLDLPTSVEASAIAGTVPIWKRILDLAIVALFLPIIVPAMALIALTIKVVSRGPVFFRQDRIGFMGKPFVCFKFRTMRFGASTAIHQGYFKQLMESNEPMTKMDNMGDPRLIPLGSVLRASGLDELPQLLNILRGEMSVVGPRPCTPFEYSNYHAWQKQRFKTLPGLTGLWQVSGKNKTTFNEMIQLDIGYVNRKSLWLDVGIILKTVPVVLLQVKEIVKRRMKRRKSLLAQS